MPALSAWRSIVVLFGALACAPKQPVQPPDGDGEAKRVADKHEADEKVAFEIGAVETVDGKVALTGMIVPTHHRPERTVEALGLSIAAQPGYAWFDLLVSIEVSDDGGFDYLHCHELVLRAVEKAGPHVTPVSTRHTVDAGKEIVAATVSLEMLERLGASLEAGGRLCADDFELSAKQQGKLREFVEAMGPVTHGTAASPAAEADTPWGKIGIVECDEYLSKYHRCVTEKVPEAARASMMDALRATADAWREAARGPGADSLATGCKAALDAAKSATASMGCAW